MASTAAPAGTDGQTGGSGSLRIGSTSLLKRLLTAFFPFAEDQAHFLDALEQKTERMAKMTEVVAALIWRDGRFLICQRPPHKARGLLWEFVGGKVEPGETQEQALIRECQEELAIAISVEEVFMEVTHEYPDLTVHLTLFCASITEGEPQKLEHQAIRWISPAEIPQYAFCPADTAILQKLQEGTDGKAHKACAAHSPGRA